MYGTTEKLVLFMYNIPFLINYFLQLSKFRAILNSQRQLILDGWLQETLLDSKLQHEKTIT